MQYVWIKDLKSDTNRYPNLKKSIITGGGRKMWFIVVNSGVVPSRLDIMIHLCISFKAPPDKDYISKSI